MIKIERSKNGWIIYNNRDFKRFHTHVKYLRVAKKIKNAVIKNIIPTTECIEVLISCKRLSYDREYIKRLEKRIEELESGLI